MLVIECDVVAQHDRVSVDVDAARAVAERLVIAIDADRVSGDPRVDGLWKYGRPPAVDEEDSASSIRADQVVCDRDGSLIDDDAALVRRGVQPGRIDADVVVRNRGNDALGVQQAHARVGEVADCEAADARRATRERESVAALHI